MKLLIVDSVDIYLEGLKSLLSPSFNLVTKLLKKDDGSSLPEEEFDLFLLGITDDLYPTNLELAKTAMPLCSRTMVILTSDCLSFLPDVVKIRPDSYLHRFAPKEIISKAVEETLNGKNFIDRKVVLWLWNLKKESWNNYNFTECEKKVAYLLLQGLTNKEISHELNVSTNTVKFHLHNVYTKLKVENRAEFKRIFT